MAAAMEATQQLEAAVAQGLAQGEFEWTLLPRLNLRSGRLAGLQARLLWHHPTQGTLTPEYFANGNNSHAIQPLLEWSLQEAARLVMQWQSLGLNVPLCLQLSSLTPRGQGLALALDRTVAPKLRHWPPGLLQLELPEHLAHETRLLDELKQRQVGLLLDSFGSGGAALSAMPHLGLAGCVLEPGLIAQVASDQPTQSIVQAIVHLADGLGLQVCAPAVATGAQAQTLQRLGCHQLQGPWYAADMSAAAASAWLASGQA
jgi:EAL domain-containing protein (putative c-di-GMP-specific phosphodiesterase class I)